MEKFVQTANIWSKRIASGMYNAGQIDFRTDENGTVELVKVNNHVWKTSKNNVEPERILESMEFWYNICNLSPRGILKTAKFGISPPEWRKEG